MIYRIIYKGIKYSHSLAKVILPEIREGDSLANSGKYAAACLSYTSALEIFTTANMRYHHDATTN